MKATDVFPLIGEAIRAAGPLYGPAYQGKIQEQGFEPGQWYLLVVGHDFEPEPVSAEIFALRSPYSDPGVFADNLAALAEQGYYEALGDGRYCIADRGHEAIDVVMTAFNDKVAEVKPLPEADMNRIISLMQRLVEGALAAPEPAEKPILTVNRASDPGPDGAPMMRILQYAADLGSFRDEIHMAAWQTLDVSGPAWEALTLVWRDEANSAATLAEQRQARRISEEGYAAALQSLVEKGWLAPAGDDGVFEITEAGRSVRQHAEDETDRMYYVAWQALNEAEIAELGDLLARMRDSAHEMAEAVAQEA